MSFLPIYASILSDEILMNFFKNTAYHIRKYSLNQELTIARDDKIDFKLILGKLLLSNSA